MDKLSTDIFKKLSDQIQNKNEGVLYQVIHILVDKKTAKKICGDKGIKENAWIEDDLKINLQNTRQPDKVWKFLNTKIEFSEVIKRNMNPDMAKVEDITTIACELVGESACTEYLKSKETPKDSDTMQLIPSALCLVVPASVVGDIRENHTINVSDIETLIESASYFLCTSHEEANTIQQRLKLTNEDITNVSEQREFYVRIDITDGQEMIGKKVQYILKRNLPPNGQGTVKELACLEYLSVSGLENFNRV